MTTEVSNTFVKRQAPQDCFMVLNIPVLNIYCEVKLILDWSDKQATLPKNKGIGWYVKGALYFHKIPNIEFLKYLKTQYKEWDIFYSEFIIPKHYDLEFFEYLLKQFKDNWMSVKAYSYEEASAITNTDYKKLVLKCF